MTPTLSAAPLSDAVPAATSIGLRLLGAPALEIGTRRLALSAKDAALLCLAALAGPIRVDRLGALLWPASTARQADTSLRQRLYRLRREAGGWRLDFERDGADLEAPLSPIAVSAAELLTSTRADRVRICGAEETGCTWLFVDRSRNSSRLWCDMAVCGNRQKASRHYRRRRLAANEVKDA